MRRVFCPPNLALGNPCLEYIKHVIFPWFGKLEVVHNEGENGNRTNASMEELIVGYESGAVDSASLKLAFERALNTMLQDRGMENTWLVDSGCSRHMIGDSKWFSSLTPVMTRGYITFGDNGKGRIMSEGAIKH